MDACATCGVALPEGARFCSACGSAVERAPSEERKLATVLFADLVGSTELGASQDPERTRALLDRFYDAMAAEIARAGGTVEKFVGDAVMAVFGAPAAQEDHAERALHTALSMRRRLSELFGDDLRLRIGVNTGEVVVGRAREGSSFVTGDAVNVCARLEQKVEPGEILVGERTAHAVRGAFEFDEPTRIEAKGKEDGVACRRLVRALTLMRPRGVGGLRRAFVGRDSELELLRATVNHAVSEREPYLVSIMGDAGVGKTRLVRELWEWLGELEPEPVRRTGRCLPYGHGITYWPLGEVLKEHLGILESDPPEEVRTRIGAREILGLTLGLDVAGELHPLDARDRLHEAWVEFLRELASERPAVVLVEDLHWAEEPLLDLLERILRDVHAPLVVLGTARPELLERRPSWGGGRRNASLIWLEPLSPEDAALMLDELLATALPPHLREVVVGRSEGNPFFVEELIGTLVDQGILERTDGGWRVNELPAGFSIPDSVHAVLASRIDLLPPGEKAALQAASVIGRIFWDGPVRELLDGAEPDFDVLEERDFVRRRSGSSLAGEHEYAIKHALTREVAYASVPKARRARLHAAFADWLERAGEGRDDHAAFLGHHYAEAARPEDADLAWTGEEAELERLRGKAVVWLRRAAELAIGRYELAEAIELLERALALESDEVGQSLLWRQIGLANALRYDGEAFSTAMQRSLAVCHDRATCADTYGLLAFHTAARAGMWKRWPDRELVQGWIERTLALAEPDTAARARALIAQAYWSGSDEAAREAAELAERLGDVELRSYAMEARATAAYDGRRFSESLTWSQRRFDLLAEIGDPDHAADVHDSMLPAVLAMGRVKEARRVADALLALSQRLSPHHRVHGFAAVTEVDAVLGSWRSILERAAAIEDAVEANLATPCTRNVLLLLRCAAASLAEDDDAAAQRFEDAADALEIDHRPALSGGRLQVALLRGDLDSLRDQLGEDGAIPYLGISGIVARLDALAALRDRERLESEAASLLAAPLLEPFALRALGVVREDDELLARALERFEALGLDWHAARTRELVLQA